MSDEFSSTPNKFYWMRKNFPHLMCLRGGVEENSSAKKTHLMCFRLNRLWLAKKPQKQAASFMYSSVPKYLWQRRDSCILPFQQMWAVSELKLGKNNFFPKFFFYTFFSHIPTFLQMSFFFIRNTI